MKTLAALAVSALALGIAGSALADSPPVQVVGQAVPTCTLPTQWVFASGDDANEFPSGGTTWNIPPEVFATSSGQPVTGAEYALRIRGNGFCNTSHIIRLESAHGGLTSGAPGDAAPPGFSNRRAMNYQAQWSLNGHEDPFGPKAAFTPTTPGEQTQVSFIVGSNAPAPPGNRFFDIRMSLQRDSASTPLVAGAYSDTVTVFLTPAP